jgi:hypothetical protein
MQHLGTRQPLPAIFPSRTGRGAAGAGCGQGSSLGLSVQASEGWANLPATTRPLQRVQPEAARGRVATDSDRQSGRAGYRLEGGGGRRTVMRVVPVPSPGHLDGGSLPGPSPRPALPMRRPGPLGILGACSWPADRFARPGTPERQAAPCRSTPPTSRKASAAWAAWTQNGVWPRPCSRSPTRPSSCSQPMGPD